MSAQLTTRISDVAYNTVKLFETNVQPLRNAVTPTHFKF